MKKVAKKFFVIEWAYIPLGKSENPSRDIIYAENIDRISNVYQHFKLLGVFNTRQEIPENIYSL